MDPINIQEKKNFELKFLNFGNNFQIECNKELEPMELLQVLSNIILMFPENKRRLACDIAVASAKGK